MVRCTGISNFVYILLNHLVPVDCHTNYAYINVASLFLVLFPDLVHSVADSGIP